MFRHFNAHVAATATPANFFLPVMVFQANASRQRLPARMLFARTFLFGASRRNQISGALPSLKAYHLSTTV